MRRIWMLTAVRLLHATVNPLSGEERLSAAAPRFTRHVVPLFSRLGCNAGACHGAVRGKNGFRLSLFGVAPLSDHASILREFGGRRLNLVEPEQSLLLLKATAAVPHQ